MKKLSLALVLSILATGAFAQSVKEDSIDRIDLIKQIRMEREILTPKTAKSGPAAAVNPADVGEADSFGKNAKFMGTAATGIVYVYSSCDPTVLLNDLELTLGPDDRCVEAATPGQLVGTTFDDIGRITFPARTADNVFFFVVNNLVNYNLLNPNANPVDSVVIYSPTITIESVALNDPAAIDPTTGLPMNGTYTTSVNSLKFNTKTITGGAQESVVERYAGTSTIGLSRTFFAALGLPNNVINRIYRNPLTVKLNVRVRSNFVTFGQFGYAIRVLGN